MSRNYRVQKACWQCLNDIWVAHDGFENEPKRCARCASIEDARDGEVLEEDKVRALEPPYSAGKAARDRYRSLYPEVYSKGKHEPQNTDKTNAESG